MSDRWQQIKELFDAASERRPEGRAAFLYAACGNDQALRSEVESLLAADEQAGSFMTGPVLGSASRSVFDPETRIAGRYRILRFLDQGGMGEVYEAEDLQLREPVALKVIRPVLALKADALERFRQEVQLARKVTHRNMCRIFDIGIQRSSDRGGCQTEKDITFLTMELLAGETLQAYLHRRGPLPLAEALPIIRQMAEGLRAAHQAGVLHLDFKSGNVILVPTGNQREPLRAVITDFGLARTHAAGTDGHPSSPAVEELMGTPNNMAPEQLESQRPTEAVDVYALGIVIYEMIAGRNPFKADVPQETLHNIRHKDPDPLAQYVSGVPAPWEALVKKMLAKDPAQRYATVAEVLAELYALAQGPAERKKAKAAAVSSRWYLMAGLLMLLMSGLLLWKVTTPQPALVFSDEKAFTDKDWVLVTDTENHTGDPAFDTLLHASLALSLEQSPHVSVFPRARLGEALQRMRLDPKQVKIDEKVGLEICRRENLRAMLSGSIYGVGGKYRLTAKIIDPSRGEAARTIAVTADRPEKLLDTLDELARETRRSLGESLSSIQKNSKRLAEVTTTSLEALRLYTDALEQQNLKNNIEPAIKLYQAAIAKDPGFASAYKSLASIYYTRRRFAEARRFAQSALERKDKLTDREAFHAQGLYEIFLDRYDSAIASYQLLTDRYPRDLSAHGNLVE